VVLLVEASGEISYRSDCSYPELAAIIAATHRPTTHNM
jgi:hypothetical protein